VRLRIILLGLVAFVMALLVVFPAAWIRSALPPQLSCAALSGSIWQGQCSGLTYTQPGQPPLRLDSVGWKLHALALLRGQAQALITLSGADLAARAELTLRSGGRIAIKGLSGTVGLDHSRLAALPAGWNARAEASNLSLDIASGRLAGLGGVLLTHQLRDARGTAFGSFKLEFPQQDSPPFRGTLTDTGGQQSGPMKLDSQLLLNADQSWQMRGTVVLRPGGPAGLASALDQLAPADINGLRSFSLEGTAH
jgi:hypothetical protein